MVFCLQISGIQGNIVCIFVLCSGYWETIWGCVYLQDIGRRYEGVCLRISGIQDICFNTYSGLVQWNVCWDQYCAQTSVHDMCHVSIWYECWDQHCIVLYWYRQSGIWSMNALKRWRSWLMDLLFKKQFLYWNLESGHYQMSSHCEYSLKAPLLEFIIFVYNVYCEYMYRLDDAIWCTCKWRHQIAILRIYCRLVMREPWKHSLLGFNIFVYNVYCEYMYLRIYCRLVMRKPWKLYVCINVYLLDT